MEKFPILCTLSALIVFFGAAISAVGVQTGKTNNPPLGFSIVEQMPSREFQGAPIAKLLDIPRDVELKLATRDSSSVEIRGDLLVSF